MKNHHRRIPQDLIAWAQWGLLLLFCLAALFAASLLGALAGCKKQPDCVVWSPVKDTVNVKPK